MQKIDKEIQEIKVTLAFRRRLFDNLKSDERATKESIDILAEEIKMFERKLSILEEKKRTGIYVPKAPELGDDRYKKFYDKEALDILRVMYYELFHKEPNLSYVMDKAMFDDNTLNIISSIYLVRGEIPFKLMLTTRYRDYKSSEDYSVGIRFNRKDLSKECAKEYLRLMSMLIKRYTNNDINFICGDCVNRECTLAYIGNKDFYYYPGASKEKMYYEFFNLLCDNNYRNIIYVGDTMKENARFGEIDAVDTEFVVPHMKAIAEFSGMTMEEFVAQNSELKKRVLVPIIK